MNIAVPSFLTLPSLSHLQRPRQLQGPQRKWPFPPVQQPAVDQPRMKAPAQARPQAVSPRQMLGDVLMVVAWGALIPGLMWLGSAVGF